jgi:hypothetical protein
VRKLLSEAHDLLKTPFSNEVLFSTVISYFYRLKEGPVFIQDGPHFGKHVASRLTRNII